MANHILKIKRLTLMVNGTPSGYHYACKVEVNGKELNMLLDTGASFTIIDESVFPKLKNKYPLSSSYAGAGGLGGTSNYQATVFNSLKFNGILFKKYPMAVMCVSPIFEMYKTYGVDEKMDGVLGMDILLHTQSVIDFGKEIIKSKRPSRPSRKLIKKQVSFIEPQLKEMKKYLKSKPKKDEPPIDISFSKSSIIDLPDGLPEAGRN